MEHDNLLKIACISLKDGKKRQKEKLLTLMFIAKLESLEETLGYRVSLSLSVCICVCFIFMYIYI